MTGREIQTRAREAYDEVRLIYLRRALEAHDWYVAPTARALEMPARTLSGWVHRYPELSARVRPPGPKPKKGPRPLDR